MLERGRGSLRAAGAALAAITLATVAVVVGLELVRPFASGPVGFDTAASVVHFDRIVSGRHLEAFMAATPKPLLTLVDGLLMAVGDDWRVVSIAAILAFAACVVLGTWLAARLGGTIAAAFVAIALLGSRSLLLDVALAYALVWVVLLWIIAGLALTGSQRQPLLAGLALGGAMLARPETAVLLVTATAAVPVGWVRGRRTGRPIDPAWWGLLGGWLAVPILWLHDLRLTGDPWFWLTVAARFSAAARASVLGPADVAVDLAGRYLAMPVLLVLGAVGIGRLLRRREWAPGLGLLALTAGLAAFLVLLAARGTYVSDRYASAIDIGLIFAAGVGLAVVVGAVAERLRGGAIERAIPIGGIVVAVLLGVAASWPVASLDRDVRAEVRGERRAAEHADRILPVLACAMDRIPGARDRPPPETALVDGDPEDIVLLVPPLSRPRFVHDLDLPAGSVAGLLPELTDPAGDVLPYGRLAVLDTVAVAHDAAYAILRVDRPTTVGGVGLTPLAADPDAGLWVVAVDRPGDEPVDLDGCAEVPG